MNNNELFDRADKYAAKKTAADLIQALAHSDLKPQILSALRQLSPNDQIVFLNCYNRKKKNRDWAQMFAVFAVHYAYLRRPLTQLIFFMTAGGVGIWYLYDLFTVQDKVEMENDFFALEALDAAKGL
ncbi:MAG: hypothetical protein WCP79_10570 [Bacillota bacterium]